MLAVRFPVISQSGDVVPLPAPRTGSLLVTDVIWQLCAAVGSQTSVTSTANCTGTSVWFGGQRTSGVTLALVMTGGVVSATFTSDRHVLVFPEVSAAVHDTDVVPSGNVEPDWGQTTEATAQLSVADALNEAVAPSGPVHSSVIGAGHEMLGAVVSRLPVARRSRTGAAGSLLLIWMNADADPPAVGVKCTVNAAESPGGTVKGVGGLGATVKFAEPADR
jgi:hypothetical protein